MAKDGGKRRWRGGGRGDDGGGGGRRVDTAGTLRPLPLSLSLSVVVWWMCGRCCSKQTEIRSAHPLRQDVIGVVSGTVVADRCNFCCGGTLTQIWIFGPQLVSALGKLKPAFGKLKPHFSDWRVFTPSVQF